jgi:hypothetical protein
LNTYYAREREYENGISMLINLPNVSVSRIARYTAGEKTNYKNYFQKFAQFHGWFPNLGSIYFLMENSEYGELGQYLKIDEGIHPNRMRPENVMEVSTAVGEIASQILGDLPFWNTKGYRDLKPMVTTLLIHNIFLLGC